MENPEVEEQEQVIISMSLISQFVSTPTDVTLGIRESGAMIGYLGSHNALGS